VTLSLVAVADFVLVCARTLAWLYTAPVFGDRGFPTMARTTVAVALGLFLTPLATHAGSAPTELGPYVVVAVGQVAAGLVLGWVASALLAAFETAGHHIDLLSGFSVSALLDPMSGTQAAVFSRFTRLTFVTLMFATGAHHSLMRGFALSFRVIPVDGMPSFSFDLPVAIGLLGTMLVASLQIAAPVLGALFLTEVTLAMAQRFAPNANIFVLGLSVKTMVALTVTGLSLTFYPVYLENLVDTGVRIGSSLVGG
jgi:flagellar biosynthesis protein FliR